MAALKVGISTGGMGNAAFPLTPSWIASSRFSSSRSGSLPKFKRGLIFFGFSVTFVVIFVSPNWKFGLVFPAAKTYGAQRRAAGGPPLHISLVRGHRPHLQLERSTL